MNAIDKTALLKIKDVTQGKDFEELKLLIHPQTTKCICINAYTMHNSKATLFDSVDEEESLNLVVGVFKDASHIAESYQIFVVHDTWCKEVMDFVKHTNIRVVTCCAKPVLLRMLANNVPIPETIWDLEIYERCRSLGRININYQVKETGVYSSKFRQDLQDQKDSLLSSQTMCRHYGIEYALSGLPASNRYEAGLELATWASIYFGQCKHAEEQGTLSHMVDTEMPWVITNAVFEHNGVRVDEDLIRKIAAAYAVHWPKIETELKNKGLSNIASKKAVMSCLRKHGLLPLFSKGKDYDVSKEALKPKIHHHQIIKDIYEYRKINALIREKLLSPGLADPDGRVHPIHVQLATETGRQASEEPNVLGLSKLVRTVIIPAPGNGIGEVDLSQIEVGIAAAYHNDEALIHAFNTGDVYSSMAQKFYGDQLTPEDMVLSGADFKHKHPQKRQALKICTLAILYGSGKASLASNLGVTTQEADALLSGFLSLYPALRDGIKHGINTGLHRGYIQTISGLRIHLDPKVSQSGRERMCRNYPIQGSAAVVFKHAGSQLRLAYPAYQSRLLIPLHDSYIFEAPLDMLEDVAQITSEIMCNSVQHFFPELEPKTEINILHPERWNKDGDIGVIDRWIIEGKY